MKKKDGHARAIMISNMKNDLNHEYEQHPTARLTWLTFKEHFVGIYVPKF